MFNSETYIKADQLTNWDIAYDLGLINKTIKKGELFLRAGQKCGHLYFILKGFVRVYYLDLEGNEITHWFCADHSTITSPFSFLKNEENILYFEALEETELILLTAAQLNTIVQNDSAFSQSIRYMNAEFAMIMSRRIMSIHTKTAEERYLALMKEHPLIFQKANLTHIASYLGITPQSLSRIRKSIQL